MNILFVHNNFPAQYKHVAAKLAADPRNKVVAIGCPTAQALDNVKLHQYSLPPLSVVQTHPFARRFDIECRRAEQVLYTASLIARSGFKPDMIMVHCGWGENLPLRAVFPNARIIVYAEFYYKAFGQDVNFDPEFSSLSIDGVSALSIKNANTLLALIDADLAISPTHWQRSTFPIELRGKIEVVHEGIDVDLVRASSDVVFGPVDGRHFRKGEEVVTFVCRNLEPLRGIHVLLRALPKILRDRPAAHVLIVGGNQISYGHEPPAGQTWKDVYLKELGAQLDTSRIHFLGNLPYMEYLKLIQISAVHVYLTYPFVLSWSLMEAMSAECVIVASDTAPVIELIDETCGVLVPFLSADIVSARIIDVLRAPHRFKTLGTSARERIVANYAKDDCVARTLEIMTDGMRS